MKKLLNFSPLRVKNLAIEIADKMLKRKSALLFVVGQTPEGELDVHSEISIAELREALLILLQSTDDIIKRNTNIN